MMAPVPPLGALDSLETFNVVLFSVLVQGTGVPLVAKRFGVPMHAAGERDQLS